MKCPRCNGNGSVPYPIDYEQGLFDETNCPLCGGSGEVQMTNEIKIRCDDCKFQENCVDYGWQDCKKFTPKPSEPMTNEEYLKSCNTEQLADVIADFYLLGFTHGYNQMDITSRTKWTEWLKEIHE